MSTETHFMGKMGRKDDVRIALQILRITCSYEENRLGRNFIALTSSSTKVI